MARFFDLRQAGSDEEHAEPTAYENDRGEIVIRIDPYDSENEVEDKPQIFMTLSIREAKALLKEMQTCVNQAIAELAKAE